MKKIVSNYSFDASERRVTLTGLAVPLERLLLIVNATRNLIIYNLTGTGHPSQPLGATVAQNSGNTVVTLAFDTTQFSDSDKLSIFYDDGTSGGNTIDAGNLTITGIESEVEIKNDEGNPVPIAVPEGVTLPVELHDGNGTPLSTQVISSSPGGAVTRALSVFQVGTGATYVTNASGTHAATVKEGGVASSPQDPFLVVGLNPTSNTVRITDGGSTTAAIKPGNIAPTALDPSLVVGLSPNSNSIRMQDGSGNNVETTTGTPTDTSRALVVKNVPSGTQNVKLSKSPGDLGTAESAMHVQGPLTNTQLRQSALSVNGNWLTNTELRASSLHVMAFQPDQATHPWRLAGSSGQVSLIRHALPLNSTTIGATVGQKNDRRYLLLQNLSATGTIHLSFSGQITSISSPPLNQVTMILPPRSSLVFEQSFIPTNAVWAAADASGVTMVSMEA